VINSHHDLLLCIYDWWRSTVEYVEQQKDGRKIFYRLSGYLSVGDALQKAVSGTRISSGFGSLYDLVLLQGVGTSAACFEYASRKRQLLRDRP